MTGEKKNDPFGSILNAALGQIDELRDVIVKGGQAGKAKLDAELLKRQRDRALAEVGAALLREVEEGACTLPPSCADAAARVRELEEQIGHAEKEAASVFGGGARKAVSDDAKKDGEGT